jgi:phosphatidylglycerophosphate synthase
MGKRVSHSLLDPYIGPALKGLYRVLPIPRWFPPEGIVLTGHLLAIVAAVGFAHSVRHGWGGLLVAVGVLGNHTADCIDGTHARSTGQCRNGGELLDHFTDPLSFAYWLVGWCVSIDRLDLGIAALIVLFATAVLTNIKAKMIGEFTLATFGPTEFKTLLVLYGLVSSAVVYTGSDWSRMARWIFVVMLAIGLVQLVVNLARSIRQVNAHGSPADTSDWQTTRARKEMRP